MNRKKEQIITARCAECDSRINFKKYPDLGDAVVCPECKTQLEVVALSPVELYWAFEDGDYDYDDDDDDDYDDYDDDDDDYTGNGNGNGNGYRSRYDD